MAALVAWLHVSGLVTGLTRMQFAPGEPYIPPAWLGASNGIVFAVTGAIALGLFDSVLRGFGSAGFSRLRIPVVRR